MLNFNRDVLAQAAALAEACHRHAPHVFAAFVGPHLRHVVEHYEALLHARAGLVDYDARPRDAACERSPAVARGRIEALREQLAALEPAALDTPVRVRLLGGLRGDEVFVTGSTLGRELMFLASHAVHHFAVLKLHAQPAGVPLPDGLGRAPATVAHDRALEAAS